MYLKLTFVFILCLCISTSIKAQDPSRFQAEVDELVQKEFPLDETKKTVVFTGSSSMRMWTDIGEVFPRVNAINTGFGGSQFTDLIHFREELIFKHDPDEIFIYEGDNDIAEGKSPFEVLADATFLYAKIREKIPSANVYFISPKPSISRWHLEDEYVQINELLQEFCEFDSSLTFVDIWNPMLNEESKPKADIFLDDNLHMNNKGYEIWADVLTKYVQSD